MEKILIIGLLTIAGVTTSLILYFGSQRSIEEASDQNRINQTRSGLNAQTSIDILNVRTADAGGALDVWVKNRGVVEIGLEAMENLDVLLMDVNGERADYIDYSPTGPVNNLDTWSLVGDQNQIWGPGDTIRISITLGANRIESRGYNISINTPDNISAKNRFDGDPTPLRPPTPTPPPPPTATQGIPPVQPPPQPPPATTCDGQIQTIFDGQEVAGELTVIGETVTYIFCGSPGKLADIYMWTPGTIVTRGRVLDTLIRITDPVGRARHNDDNHWRVMDAFNNGELSVAPAPVPPNRPYNSAILTFDFGGAGAYRIVADSYRNRGIGDYRLKIVGR